MKKIILALLATSAPVSAYAQTADDVVVMRRVVAPPNTTSQNSGADRVAMNVADPVSMQVTANRYRKSGSLTFVVSETACVVNRDDTISFVGFDCARGSGPTVGEIISVNSGMDPDLKSVYVAQTDLRTALPHAPQMAIDALCESRITVGNESWRLSCDPSSILNEYQWNISSLRDPALALTLVPNGQNLSPSGDTINLYVSNLFCSSTITGNAVGSQFCNGITKEPRLYDVVPLRATFVGDLRIAYVSKDEIRNAAPKLSDPAINQICNQSISIGAQGAKQSWRLSCAEIGSASDYSREINRVYDISQGNSAVDVNKNVSSGSTFSFYVSLTSCYQYSTNTSVSNSLCAFLPEGANVYDLVTLPVEYVPSMRDIVFNPDDLAAVGYRAASPSSVFQGAYSAATLCTSGISFKVDRQDWRVSCAKKDPANYERVVKTFLDPTKMQLGAMNSAGSDKLKFVVKSTACFNNTENKASVDRDCTFLTSGANVYDVISVDASYEVMLREIYINRDDILASVSKSPDLQPLDGANIATFCGGNHLVSVGAINMYVVCGAPDSASNYTRSIAVLRDVDEFSSSKITLSLRNNSETANVYKFGIMLTVCRDASGAVAASRKCEFLDGPQINDVVEFSAQINPSLREVYLNRNELINSVKNSHYPGSSLYHIGAYRTIDKICDGTVGTPIAGKTYLISCGQPDSASNYTRSIAVLRDVDEFSNSSIPLSLKNNSETANVYKFGVMLTVCRDASGAVAASRKCEFLDGPQINDVVEFSAQINPSLREVYLNRDELINSVKNSHYPGSSLYHIGAYRTIDKICDGTVGTPIAGKTYLISCGQPDSASNYTRSISVLSDFNNISSSRIPTSLRNNSETASVYKFAVTATTCRDASGAVVNSRKCEFIDGPDIYSIVEITSQINKDLRHVYLDKSELMHVLRNSNHPASTHFNMDTSRSIDQICTGVNTKIAGLSYVTRCME